MKVTIHVFLNQPYHCILFLIMDFSLEENLQCISAHFINFIHLTSGLNPALFGGMCIYLNGLGLLALCSFTLYWRKYWFKCHVYIFTLITCSDFGLYPPNWSWKFSQPSLRNTHAHPWALASRSYACECCLSFSNIIIESFQKWMLITGKTDQESQRYQVRRCKIAWIV